MKPKLLKITGLNSFVEEKVIDFTALTGQGLFGIFGPTGSGKSSILDAITIALYGKISRDTREFINKEKEELYIFFNFALGSGTDYIVERKMKISDNGGYNTILARLVEREKEQEIVYDKVSEIDRRLEELIGLSNEDFLRTVVLPQGRFSRFLKLTGLERRNMLERILGLEEFGINLIRKMKKQKSDRTGKIDRIEAVLNKYEDISDQRLKEEQTILKDLYARYRTVANDLKKKREEYDQYKEIRQLQDELEKYQEEKNSLLEKKEEIDTQRFRLDKTQKAVSIKSDLNRYIEWTEEVKDTRQKFDQLSEEITKLLQKKDQLAGEYRILEEEKEKELPGLMEKKVKIKDIIELAEKNNLLGQEIGQKEDKINSLKGNLKKLNSTLKKIKEKVTTQEVEIVNQEEMMEKLLVTLDYRKAIASGLDLEKGYRRQRDQIEKINLEKETIEKNIKQEKKDITALEAGILQAYARKIEIDDNRREKLNSSLFELDNELNLQKDKLVKLENELKESQRSNMAGLLAQQLQAGAPCPVCGSSEHPLIAEMTDYDLNKKEKEVKKAEKTIKSLEKDINVISSDLHLTEVNLERLRNERNDFVNSITNRVEDLQDLTIDEADSREDTRDRLNRLRGSLDNHHKILEELNLKYNEELKKLEILKGEYSNELERLKIMSFDEESRLITSKDKEIEEIRLKLKSLKKRLKKNAEEKEKLQEELRQKEDVLVQINSSLEKEKQDFAENSSRIRDVTGERKPEVYFTEIELKEKDLLKNADRKKEALQKAEEDCSQKKGRKSTIEGRLEHLNTGLEQLKVFLDHKMTEFDFDHIEEARSFLVWEGSVKEWERMIKEYEKKEVEISNNIKRLTEKLAGNSIKKEEWERLEKDKSELEESLEGLNLKIGGQDKTIEQLKENLEDKKKKETEKKVLDHELALIKEIDDLIRGKSFVEFVAMRQLRYIAHEASKRLMEITNTRYRLELNDQGEFIISDLYNGGVKRDCNTLSGGETFLTSLSLALALSSQIQLKGGSKMETFFLDEGFGTLDTNLLDIVMNSLEKLQNEDLIVGIISHVEELKNRVPVKLMVKPARPGISGTEVEIEYT